MVGAEPFQVVHTEPVWRDRSDFIIVADIVGDGEPYTEQLWVRRVNGLEFEMCCIPFFLYDVSLGDLVETDVTYRFTRVAVSSGRYVFRAWFGDSFYPRDKVADELQALGTLLEWSSTNLLAIDARNEAEGGLVAEYLTEAEESGWLTYETGRS